MTAEFFGPYLSLGNLDVVVILLSIYMLVQIVSVMRRSSSLPLPPDPRPLPLVGNILDLPKGHEGPHWAKHKATSGPISSLKVFSTTFIIINDSTIANDLLHKRSAIYSDRPSFPFGGQMVGFDLWLTTFKPYSDEFRSHRKHFHDFIGTRSAMSRFEQLEEVEARRFLLQMLKSPENFVGHIRALPKSLILKMSYGYTTNTGGSDPLVSLADEVMAKIFSNACVYGNWTVDMLPFLRYLPGWLPGMGFKRRSSGWSKTVASFYDKPYAFVQRQRDAGKVTESFITETIDRGISEGRGEHIMKAVAASLYAGGSDTTVSALLTFYLAMVLHTNVLKRAQEEIDGVIGPNRLPSIADRENLPYVEALVQETLRWENVAPVNVPHRVMEDDTYMDYSIPKGAVIVANIWQMTHDPESYHDPDKFKPERFLGENGMAIEPDPRALVFGFGRRICPGKDLADSSLFIVIAMSVAVFNITKAKDKLGNDIEPLYDYVPGLIIHPKPFQCSVKPRSEKAAGLIQAIVDEFPLEDGDGNTDGDTLQSLPA